MRLAIATLCLLGMTAAAGAQYFRPQGPQQSPIFVPPAKVSPYLNLIRGGNPATNYYLGVLPEFRDQANSQILNQVVRDTYSPARSTVAAPESLDTLIPTVPQTGHATGFMTTQPYFNFPTQQRSYTPFSGGVTRPEK